MLPDKIKRLDTIAISQIVGFSGGNPKRRTQRDHDILDASLEQHGYVMPVAVFERADGKFELIDGHGRIDRIRTKHGDVEQLKVLVLDVKDVAEGRRILLALKHTAEWDFTALESFVKDTLDDGASVNDIMATSGLTAADLDILGSAGEAFLDQLDNGAPHAADSTPPPERKPIEQDNVPEVPAEPVTKPGDVWQLGDSLLICDDCTTVSPQRMTIGSIGLGVTSPPYNAGKNLGRIGKEGSDSRYNEPDDMDSDAYADLLSSSTKLLLRSCRVSVINLQSLAANKRVIARWAAKFCDHLIDRAVWSKGHGAPAINPNVFNAAFEDLYIYSSQRHPKRTIETASFHGTVNNVHEGPSATRDNDYSAIHNATMPIHLAQFIIETLGQRADFIVDPFGGTGTSLIVATKLGKRGALIERDPAYCDVIIERWKSLTGGEPIKVA